MPTHLLPTRLISNPYAPRRGTALLLFASWSKSLESCEAGKIADLYAADAVLRDPFSDRALVGREEIRDHFSDLLGLGNVRAHAPIVRFQHLTDECALAEGFQTFVLLGSDRLTRSNRVVTVEFNIELRRNSHNREWEIMSHHSSRVWR